MLSRRNVRIKVMQMLYTLSRDQDLTYDGALKQYRKIVFLSFELYLFNLLLLIRVAEYAKQDLEKRRAKLRPTDDDKRFTAKLAENPLIASLLHNDAFNSLIRGHKLPSRIDEDQIRQFYMDFAKTDQYKAYLKQNDSQHSDHKDILLALFKHCLNNESFTEVLDDNYPLWIDDKSLVVGAIKKTLKALPVTSEEFYQNYQPSDEAVKEFGELLLHKVYHEDADLLELIEPTLKNWDADRVAAIDMILLKMALCELMNFPTIPTKVTLNEFVEIAKLYSTEKSKDFINGILDRLMKKLNKDGKINKEGRGLLES